LPASFAFVLSVSALRRIKDGASRATIARCVSVIKTELNRVHSPLGEHDRKMVNAARQNLIVAQGFLGQCGDAERLFEKQPAGENATVAFALAMLLAGNSHRAKEAIAELSPHARLRTYCHWVRSLAGQKKEDALARAIDDVVRAGRNTTGDPAEIKLLAETSYDLCERGYTKQAEPLLRRWIGLLPRYSGKYMEEKAERVFVANVSAAVQLGLLDCLRDTLRKIHDPAARAIVELGIGVGLAKMKKGSGDVVPTRNAPMNTNVMK